MIAIARRAVFGALALMFVLPAVASAQPFKVSRDVGVYAATNVDQGVGVKKAGSTVDVQCWTTGQRIQGYDVWDRIAFGSGTAYVHDKYVEMGGGSPADNRIERCEDTAQPPQAPPKPAPGAGRCVAQKWVQFLASIDHSWRTGVRKEIWGSILRVKWTAKFCPKGNGDYIFSGTPEYREFSHPYVALGMLKFELGEADENADGRRVTYDPRLRLCPLSKLSGGCFTVAKMRMMVRLIDGQVRFDRSVHTFKRAGRQAFAGYLGWRHKERQTPEFGASPRAGSPLPPVGAAAGSSAGPRAGRAR